MHSLDIFKKMAPILDKSGASIVSKVGCIYQFELRKKAKDVPTVVTIDLKNGNGSVQFQKVGRADCTFVMLDADFMKMANGKLDPKTAFMTGKVKIKGNMAKAMKFNPSVLPRDAKL